MNNLGNIYFEYYGDKEKAMEYYKQGLELCNRYRYIEVEILILNNIGEIYIRKYEYKKAKYYIEKSKNIAMNVGDKLVHMLTNVNLGYIYLYLGDFENCYICFSLISGKYEKNALQNVDLLGQYYNFLGEFYFKFGKWKKSLEYTHKAIEACKGFKIKEYLIAKNRLLLINYFYKGVFDKKEIEKLRTEYRQKNLCLDRRKTLLQFAAISILEEDYKYARELLREEGKLKKESISVDFIETVRKFIIFFINNQEKNEEQTKEVEELLKNTEFLELQLLGNLLMGNRYYKKEKYYKALNYYLEFLDTMYKLVSDIPSRELQISYIERYGGDRIKEKIQKIFKNVLHKDIEYVCLKDINRKDSLKKYFNLNALFDLIDDETFTKIIDTNYTDYDILDNIYDIESLINNFTDNYMLNLELIIKFLARETYAQKGFISVYDEKEGKYLSIVNLKEYKYDDIDKNIFGLICENERGIFIKNDFKNMKDNIFQKIIPQSTNAIMCVPIVKNESHILEKTDIKREKRKKKGEKHKNIIGYIYLETNKMFNRFDEERLNMANTLSNLAFLNIENYNFKTLATIDEMTGTFTRKYFDMVFKDFMKIAEKNNKKFSMIMIDIDRFKNINDTYGHLRGDKVLKKIGNILVKNIRKTDIVARYGGEEFIVVLKDINESEAINVAEKLRKEIEDLKIQNGDEFLTISIGISMYPRHSQFKEELIEKADQALYNAKETGRNRVVMWKPDMGNTFNRVDRLAGIISGNMARDQRNVLAIMDIMKLIKMNESKEKKIYEFLGRLLEALDGEYSILFIVVNEDQNEISEKVYVRRRFDLDWAQKPKVNKDIIKKVLETRKGEFLIDWDTIDCIDIASGIPDWQSIIVIPLIFEENIKGIVYISVPVKEKEFDYDSYNFSNALCRIFAAVI